MKPISVQVKVPKTATEMCKFVTECKVNRVLNKIRDISSQRGTRLVLQDFVEYTRTRFGKDYVSTVQTNDIRDPEVQSRLMKLGYTVDITSFVHTFKHVSLKTIKVQKKTWYGRTYEVDDLETFVVEEHVPMECFTIKWCCEETV